MVTIGQAKPEDGEAIRRLSGQIEGFNHLDVNCIEELWTAYNRDGLSSGYGFVVARNRRGLLGFACFGPTPLTEDVWDLYWLAVNPAHRRRGIGHLLLEFVEEHIRGHDGRMLLVETSGTREYGTARRFYEACGYHYQAVIHDFYAVGDDLLIFGKRFRDDSED